MGVEEGDEKIVSEIYKNVQKMQKEIDKKEMESLLYVEYTVQDLIIE